MELPFAIIILFLAFFVAYLRGLIRLINQDVIDEIINESPEKSQKIIVFWNNYDKFDDSLIIFKFALYIVFSIITGQFFSVVLFDIFFLFDCDQIYLDKLVLVVLFLRFQLINF